MVKFDFDLGIRILYINVGNGHITALIKVTPMGGEKCGEESPDGLDMLFGDVTLDLALT